jgi:hypothetical protein
MTKLRKKSPTPAAGPQKLWRLLSKFLTFTLILTLTQQLGPLTASVRSPSLFPKSIKSPARITTTAYIVDCKKPRTTLWCKEPGVCVCVFDLEGCNVYEYETG